MRIVDLRSDTITQPTDAMRKAMYTAEVGDDVFGEDPTVNKIEEMTAEMLGKEGAMFVASGTMGNLICQLTHCGRGDEIILGEQAHIFLSEQGGASALGGIHHRTLPNGPDGTMVLEDIETAIRNNNVHFPITRLIGLENTHNFCHGSPISTDYMRAVAKIARKYDLKIHLDGARIFNAAVALNKTAGELAADADSVSVCLSKGLAAPAGSVVCGNREFITEARRARKIVGGGMRQVGILAAAGIVAFEEMVDRLAEDHANARKLAEGLAVLDGISIDPAFVKTNIVIFECRLDHMSNAELIDKLNTEGVRILAINSRQLRAVTQYHTSTDDIDYTLAAFTKVFR